MGTAGAVDGLVLLVAALEAAFYLETAPYLTESFLRHRRRRGQCPGQQNQQHFEHCSSMEYFQRSEPCSFRAALVFDDKKRRDMAVE